MTSQRVFEPPVVCSETDSCSRLAGHAGMHSVHGKPVFPDCQVKNAQRLGCPCEAEYVPGTGSVRLGEFAVWICPECLAQLKKVPKPTGIRSAG